MREILFRGQAENGMWFYGYLTKIHGFYTIQYEDCEGFYCEELIKPETVGQFTGLTDKNGTKIFEGDILQPPCWCTKCNLNCVCIYAEEHTTESIQGFALYHKINDCVELVQSDEWDEFEVIGNIHDNPELLQGVKE